MLVWHINCLINSLLAYLVSQICSTIRCWVLANSLSLETLLHVWNIQFMFFLNFPNATQFQVLERDQNFESIVIRVSLRLTVEVRFWQHSSACFDTPIVFFLILFTLFEMEAPILHVATYWHWSKHQLSEANLAFVFQKTLERRQKSNFFITAPKFEFHLVSHSRYFEQV